MGNINYQKVLDYLVINQPGDIDKIKKVVIDAKCVHQRAVIPFEKIILSDSWDASEKEVLLRLFEYELRDHYLEYYNKSGFKTYLLAIFHTIRCSNISGLTALIRTLRECKSREFKNKYVAYIEIAKDIVENKFANQSELLEILLDSMTYEKMKETLRDKFTIVHYGVKHESLFHYIVASQDLNLIKRCIPFIENVDLYLSSAVSLGNKEVVSLLLKQGANINFSGVPILGMVSPLKTAIIKNDFEMVKYLIEQGANIEENDSLGEVEDKIIARFNNRYLAKLNIKTKII